eukprot:jgi/Botrbrau1/7563/Bobra.0159s0013.1
MTNQNSLKPKNQSSLSRIIFTLERRIWPLRKMWQQGWRGANISLAGDEAETLALPQASVDALRKQEELLAIVEERRRIRETVVPTDDKEVRRMLRALEEPITRFGEREVRQAAFESMCLSALKRVRTGVHSFLLACSLSVP